jgi:opacity protein-like surface antigen
MKCYLLAAACAAALVASPAAARDHSGYFGIEVGAMWANKSHVSATFPTDGGSEELTTTVKHKLGVDGDLIAGYDFGMFRAELEGGYKWAKHKSYCSGGECDGADGHSRVYSIMGNALIDLGRDDRVNFYAGGGVGMAWLRQTLSEDGDASHTDISDNNLAWQAIAGVRAPVFRHFDVGLKYRYFDGGKIKDDFTSGATTIPVRSRFRSHSLLASLIFNFGAPAVALPPPPPPAPVAPVSPATQTCADGSVILATDTCPAPPPPPPPPEPAPERGL